MSKLLISLVALTALTAAAQAQAPAPAVPPPALSDATKPTGSGETANQQTYKMKDGGMYEPPAQRPASPAMDTKTYGRT